MENKRRKIEETLQDSVIWDNSLIKRNKSRRLMLPWVQKEIECLRTVRISHTQTSYLSYIQFLGKHVHNSSRDKHHNSYGQLHSSQPWTVPWIFLIRLDGGWGRTMILALYPHVMHMGSNVCLKRCVKHFMIKNIDTLNRSLQAKDSISTVDEEKLITLEGLPFAIYKWLQRILCILSLLCHTFQNL